MPGVSLHYYTKNIERNPLNNFFYPGFILVFFGFFATLLPLTGPAQAEVGPGAGPVDIKQIEGYWVRPDGGYILYLQKVQEDGSLTAAYFNPRPINVFRTELSSKEGKINLFVELRDANYPGSTYTLAYDPATDRLRGVYFQATSGNSFHIEFERMK